MRESYIHALRTFVRNDHVQSKLEPDYLIGELRNKGIITQQEADDILAKSSRVQRQQELFLDLVPKRDDYAFQTLLDVMDHENYHWARKLLELYERQDIHDDPLPTLFVKEKEGGALMQD